TSSDIWINQNLLASSTLLDIGQSDYSFDEVYADQFLSSQTNSITFGTNSGVINRIYLKFGGSPPESLILNESATSFAGSNNTAFGYRTLTNIGSSNNNNVAIGNAVLDGTSVGSDNVGIGYSALAVTTSSENVAIGSSAMQVNSLGTQNVAVGANSLVANTQGQYNVGIGYNSMVANTSGESNIAIGKDAMGTNTIGQRNVIIGTDADVAANNLQNAIAIGNNATVNASNTIRLGDTNISSMISSGTLTLDGVTYPNTTGTVGQVLTVSSTTDILYFADAGSLPSASYEGATLRWNSTAADWESTTDLRIAPGTGFSPSTALWIDQSLIPSSTLNLGQSGNEFEQTFTEEIRTSSDVLTLTTKAESVYLKRNSLNFEMTTNNGPIGPSNKSNVTFGINALGNSSSGAENNVAVGVNPMQNLTSGDNNVAIGSNIMTRVTTGQFNTGVGGGALAYIDTASATTGIGYRAGINATGSYNTAVGYHSMRAASGSVGINNSSFGVNALHGLTTGSNNIAIGNRSSYSNTTAENNVAVGYEALEANQTSGENVAIGYQALNANRSERNVAIGSSSMDANTSGNSNVALGYQAMDANVTGNNNVIIGASADVGANNLTNAMAIGYNAVVNTSDAIQLGNTAIVTVTTSGVVSSSGYFDASLGNKNEMLVVGDQSRIISTEILNIDSTNDLVGINTTTPSTTLHLVGEATGTGQIFIEQNDSSSDGPDIRFLKSGGSNSSKSAYNSGDNLGFMNTFAYTTSGYIHNGAAGWTANGTAGDTTYHIHTMESGTRTPRLQIQDGNTRILGYMSIEDKNDGAFIDFILDGTSEGTIDVDGSGAYYNTSSDYRLKEDFKDFDALSLVRLIKIYDYKWKGISKRGFGVKAHELQTIIPYLVKGEKDGKETQKVDYSKLVPVLTKAIQEQQKVIEQQEEKIKQLEKLMERVKKLEA
ncbi:MAG: tail fiber domain-containing protein, partial [Flavobacteriaceae bacterium]